MLDFKEELLQFLWQHKLFLPKTLISNKGKRIEILHQGELNPNAGPDFFNAQIKIEGILLVGNVEIHIKSSDWLKHGHDNDNSYNHIILHAVYDHDLELNQNVKHEVEVLELKHYIDPEILQSYRHLIKPKQKLACAKQLKRCDDTAWNNTLEQALANRMSVKMGRLQHHYAYMADDYTQTFYLTLLRNFGFKVNAESFELLAKQLPCGILLKHRDNLLQTEALLLGMAGLLDEPFRDAYPKLLQNEFEFLKIKYRLRPLNREIFKCSRLRPANFPDSRLAQFAAFMHHCSHVFLAPHKHNDMEVLSNQLQFPCSAYWQSHYQLNGKKVNRTLNIGAAAIENIVINSFVPFLFFYGQITGKKVLQKKALELLQSCAFEKNNITKLFLAKGVLLKNAAQSQALIHLYQNDCQKKQCLSCGIASNILKAKAI